MANTDGTNPAHWAYDMGHDDYHRAVRRDEIVYSPFISGREPYALWREGVHDARMGVRNRPRYVEEDLALTLNDDDDPNLILA